MSNKQPSLLNRYGLLSASLSMFALACVILFFRLHDLGILAIIMSILAFVLATFLLFVFVSNHRS